MDFSAYTTQAIKTESIIDAIVVDKSHFAAVAGCVIAAGNLLDVIKKDVYYGKPTDEMKLIQRELRIRSNLNALATVAPTIGNSTSDVQTFNHINTRTAHAIIGLTTEAVELLEALQLAVTTGQPIDAVNVQEELGDVAWYLAVLVDSLQADWDSILTTNLNKLALRNKGTSFNAAATINRDVDTERALLEAGLG